jgi:hypothetical protein
MLKKTFQQKAGSACRTGHWITLARCPVTSLSVAVPAAASPEDISPKRREQRRPQAFPQKFSRSRGHRASVILLVRPSSSTRNPLPSLSHIFLSFAAFAPFCSNSSPSLHSNLTTTR